eukprot:scaffold33435_cov112-Isochrysis_galbana.AAC.1
MRRGARRTRSRARRDAPPAHPRKDEGHARPKKGAGMHSQPTGGVNFRSTPHGYSLPVARCGAGRGERRPLSPPAVWAGLCLRTSMARPVWARRPVQAGLVPTAWVDPKLTGEP